jgi:hypothetical protein
VNNLQLGSIFSNLILIFLNPEWEALFDRRVGHRVELLIRIPPNVGVGLWKLSVLTWFGEKPFGQNGGMSQIHHSDDPFYILFNPFVESKKRLSKYFPTT